jgi:hypothetical protein
MKRLVDLFAAIRAARLNRQLAEINGCARSLIRQMDRDELAGYGARVVSVSQRVLGLYDIQVERVDILIPRSVQAQSHSAQITPSSTYSRDYVADSLFLCDCHSYLTRGRAEHMLAVTGIHWQNLYTLERMVRLDLETQTAVRATATDVSVFDALLSLADAGHALHGVFHSHRMNGAPTPSSIDTEFQKRLDKGHYPAMQAIFSDDGYIRFFGGQKPFTIQVYGTGVKKIDERTYRLAGRN